MTKALVRFGIVIFFIPIICFGLDNKQKNSYYVDNAKILNKDTKDYINTYSNYLNENLNVDLYVTTLQSLDNLTIEELSDKIYKEKNISENGLLILMAKENREVRIKTGSEMSKIITDEMITEYLDKFFVPYLSIGNWNAGIKNGYSAVFKTICDSYDIDTSIIEVKEENKILINYRYYIIAIITWILTYLNMIYCNFIKYSKKKKHPKAKVIYHDSFILIPTLIVNISLLVLAYCLTPILSLILFCYQALVLYLNKNSFKNKKYSTIKNKSTNQRR